MSQLHGPVFLHITFFNVTPLLKGKEEVFWALKITDVLSFVLSAQICHSLGFHEDKSMSYCVSQSICAHTYTTVTVFSFFLIISYLMFVVPAIEETQGHFEDPKSFSKYPSTNQISSYVSPQICVKGLYRFSDKKQHCVRDCHYFIQSIALKSF